MRHAQCYVDSVRTPLEQRVFVCYFLCCPVSLHQGGPTFFFPRAKNSFPVGPKDQETPPGTIF
jgi:hypothetical protein